MEGEAERERKGKKEQGDIFCACSIRCLLFTPGVSRTDCLSNIVNVWNISGINSVSIRFYISWACREDEGGDSL